MPNNHQLYIYKADCHTLEACLTAEVLLAPGMWVCLDFEPHVPESVSTRQQVLGHIVQLSAVPANTAGMPAQQTVFIDIAEGRPLLGKATFSVWSPHEMASHLVQTLLPEHAPEEIFSKPSVSKSSLLPFSGLPFSGLSLTFGNNLAQPFNSPVERLGTLTRLIGDTSQYQQCALFQWILALSDPFQVVIVDPVGAFGTFATVETEAELAIDIQSCIPGKDFYLALEALQLPPFIEILRQSVPDTETKTATHLLSKSLGRILEETSGDPEVGVLEDPLETWSLALAKSKHPVRLLLSAALSGLIASRLFSPSSEKHAGSSQEPSVLPELATWLKTQRLPDVPKDPVTSEASQSAVQVPAAEKILWFNLSGIPEVWRSTVYNLLCQRLLASNNQSKNRLKPLYPVLVYPEHYLNTFAHMSQQAQEQAIPFAIIPAKPFQKTDWADNIFQVAYNKELSTLCYQLSGKLTGNIAIDLNASDTPLLTEETRNEPDPEANTEPDSQPEKEAEDTLAEETPNEPDPEPDTEPDSQPEKEAEDTLAEEIPNEPDPEPDTEPDSQPEKEAEDTLAEETRNEPDPEPDTEPDNETTETDDDVWDFLEIDIQPSKTQQAATMLSDQFLMPPDLETPETDWPEVAFSSSSGLNPDSSSFLTSQELEALLAMGNREEATELFKTIPVNPAEPDLLAPLPVLAAEPLPVSEQLPDKEEEKLLQEQPEHAEQPDRVKTETSKPVETGKSETVPDLPPDLPPNLPMEQQYYNPIEALSASNAAILDDLFGSDDDAEPAFNFSLTPTIQPANQPPADPGHQSGTEQRNTLPLHSPPLPPHGNALPETGEDTVGKTGKNQPAMTTEVITEEALPVIARQSPAGEDSPFEVGSRVRHPQYGEGEVKKIIPVEGSIILNVWFDTVGKRLLDPGLSALEKMD